MNTLRSCIAAESGYTFVVLDASQIELRVLAILSGDPRMLEDLKTGDLHKATAIRMYGLSDDPDEMKKRRYRAKTGNFATVYGAGSFQLAATFQCSEEEAQEFLDEHKATYPRLYQWMEEVKAQAREDGFVKTMLGRIRPIPEIHSGIWKLREKAEKESVNTIVQGSAVDIVKMMMLYLRSILDKSVRLVLQVHDEMVWEVPDHLVEQTLEICKELIPAFPDYPTKIETGKCYGELKGI